MSVFKIERDENYKYTLRREGTTVHLWKVILPNESTVFVMASKESDAISQATAEIREPAEYNALQKHAHAFKVPFRIRGWSDEEF